MYIYTYIYIYIFVYVYVCRKAGNKLLRKWTFNVIEIDVQNVNSMANNSYCHFLNLT